MPFADYANLIGLKGIKVTTAAEIEGAWEEAFAADRPVIIDAITTPDEPPIPPHVTRKEAEALMKSVLEDPKGGWRGALEGIRETVQAFVPGH
jgi:pyruvate dehydrogenase (quinone)